MGTAFTEQHTRLMRRFADRAVLLFDGDKAGRKAVRASAPLLTRAGIGAKVVTLPAGDDPDTFVRERGAEALRQLIDAAPGIVEHLIDEAAADSAGDASQKGKAIGELGPILASVDNPVERGLYVERVARKFGIGDIDTVRQQLRRGLRESRSGRRDRSAPGPGAQRPRAPAPSLDREVLPALESELLGAILDHPGLFRSDVVENFESLLTSEALRSIFQAAAGMIEERGALDAATLLAQIAGNPALTWLNGRLAIQKYDAEGADRALRDGIPQLHISNLLSELPELDKHIKEAWRAGDEERARSLTRRRDELTQKAHRLKSANKR
jgi:DNA primase